MLDSINGVKVKAGTTEAEFASVLAYWCALLLQARVELPITLPSVVPRR